MLKAHPLAIRFALFVLLPVALVSIAIFFNFRRSLPADQEELTDGVYAARIVRDAHGMALVSGKTDQDVFYAMGYAHAQDRLWQLELERRLAQGRLGEILGRKVVSQDMWMRTLNLYGAAQSSWEALSPEAKSSLNAYADGVNAWIKEKHPLPPEFQLLGVKPEPWQPVDSLAWEKVFALNLAENMWAEVSNAVVKSTFSEDQAQDILGEILLDQPAESSPHIVNELSKLLHVRDDLQHNLKIGGRYVGSNAWVVSGKFMRSGGGALANDPHLALNLPSLWYAAHLKGGNLDVSGMTIVGLPIVIFGRNRDIAWGGTSMMADVQQLYIEQVNPRNPKQYLRDGKWLNFIERTEVIKVKPDFPAFLRGRNAPIRIQVRQTVDGPVVSDVAGVLEQPVTLRWTSLDSGDRSYEAFLNLNYATNWDSFKSSFVNYVAPAMNILYADRAGNIGSIGVGKIPIRGMGSGQLPVPAWDNDYAWRGYIPYSEMPTKFNPDQGYIINANNKPVDDEYPYFLSSSWAPPTRARRIKQMLDRFIATQHGLTVRDFAEMQSDQLDLSAGNLKSYLGKVPPATVAQKQAIAYIDDWSGKMDRDSQGAAIFFVWTRLLREKLFLANAANSWAKEGQRKAIEAAISRTTNDQLLTALTKNSSHWCDSRTDDIPCLAVLRDSLNAAVDELVRLRGNDMEHWKWGDIHETLYPHTPFSSVDPISSFFERRISSGGSTNTIDVADAVYKPSDKYQQTFGAGFRQIIQWGRDERDPVTHWYMNSTGQSGNVFSPHYDDMISKFSNGDYFEMDRAKELGSNNN